MMADHGRDGGGASWKLNIYWLPERSLELDPFRCFANRLQRVVAAKRETAAAAGRRRAAAVRLRATRAASRRTCAAGSVAYAFADPPYGGEGIQYAELSALWCAWLDPPLAPGARRPRSARTRTAAGIATPSRRASLDGFRAVHRALVAGRAHDRHVRVARRRGRGGRSTPRWPAPGFRVDEQVELGRSAPGLTERTSPGATRTDAWLECVRLSR